MELKELIEKWEKELYETHPKTIKYAMIKKFIQDLQSIEQPNVDKIMEEINKHKYFDEWRYVVSMCILWRILERHLTSKAPTAMEADLKRENELGRIYVAIDKSNWVDYTAKTYYTISPLWEIIILDVVVDKPQEVKVDKVCNHISDWSMFVGTTENRCKLCGEIYN